MKTACHQHEAVRGIKKAQMEKSSLLSGGRHGISLGNCEHAVAEDPKTVRVARYQNRLLSKDSESKGVNLLRMNSYPERARVIQQYIVSVGVILALAFSPATLSAQNAPSPEATPKPAAEQEQSVLKVSAEAPCEFYIDDEKKGQVSSGKPMEVLVGVGEHLFKATCEKGGTWELDDKVETTEQKVVRIRFITYQGGVVLDAKTGLMWASRDNGSDINWADAKAYCDNYSGGGYSDWRMPTLDEMEEVYYSKSYLRFIQFTGYAVWSSKVRNSSAAYFHFSNGSRRSPHQSNTSGTRALPVRGGK